MEFLIWILRLIFFFARKEFEFVTLSPPSANRQIAINLQSRKLITVSASSRADKITFRQVFAEEQYSVRLLKRSQQIMSRYFDLVSSKKTPLIFDIGANVGFASIYFRTLFPAARIVSVEPSRRNFDKLKNIADQYNIDILNLGLASSKSSLKIVDPGLGENGLRTAPSSEDDKDTVLGLSLDDLQSKFESCVPFILKIDIEGAEKSAFLHRQQSLKYWDVIFLEPHDWLLPGEQGWQPVLRQLVDEDYDLVIRGENLCFIRNIPKET